MPIATALLVSNDPATIHQVNSVLAELSISSDVCQEGPASIRLLNCRKFDVVIVDLELGEHSGIALDAVRLSPSNRTAVTFAIAACDTTSTAVFSKKAGFVFARPLSRHSILGILKPAYGLILRERRRYFRCPVTLPVTILRQMHPDIHCYSVNVSEGGMGVSCLAPLPIGESVHVQFTLPDHKAPFFAESKVLWWKTGHLGIRFESVSEGLQSEMQDWLSQELEKTLPESVAGQFLKTE